MAEALLSGVLDAQRFRAQKQVGSFLGGSVGSREGPSSLYPWTLVSFDPGNLGLLPVGTIVPLNLCTLDNSQFPGRAVGSVGMSEPTLNNLVPLEPCILGPWQPWILACVDSCTFEPLDP